MNFNYPGYDIKFIQMDKCRDESDHLYTLIYKFFSPITKYHYVIRVECHSGNLFALKFYCKKDRRCENKYSKTINRGDLGNIVISCLKVVPLILMSIPDASFAFSAARAIDTKSGRIENAPRNQRYNTWVYIVSKKLGNKTFVHFEYPHISSYMLVNRKHKDFQAKEADLRRMLCDTYNELNEI